MDIVLALRIAEYVSLAILFFLFVYSSLQRPSEMQKHITILIFANILIVIGYCVEIGANSLETALVGTYVSYLGKPIIMLAALQIIMTFYSFKMPKWLASILLIFSGLYSALVFTNGYHHLYYSSVQFDQTKAFSPLVLTHGLLYCLSYLTSIGYFVAIVVVIIIGLVTVKSKLRKSLSRYSILMLSVCALGYLAFIHKLSFGFDSTIFGLTIGIIFLCVLFFKYRIFDVIDSAKDYVLDQSRKGIIIIDDTNKVAYQNETATMLLDYLFNIDDLKKFQFGETISHNGSNVYSVTVLAINRGVYSLGKSIEIRDITLSYKNNARLEKAVSDTTGKIAQIQKTVYNSVASIIEARNFETGDHVKRVSEITEKIAKQLQREGLYFDILTNSYISMLSLSAPLHDVGKIAISDTILNKPGRLTDEEFETIKTHSSVGAGIVRSVLKDIESPEYIEMAASIAMYHHEWYNGRGYPSKLAGEEIPLPARIVAIADCFDALTSERCYKAAYTKEEAIGIIKEETGTHFDPVIVAAFLKVI